MYKTFKYVKTFIQSKIPYKCGRNNYNYQDNKVRSSNLTSGFVPGYLYFFLFVFDTTQHVGSLSILLFVCFWHHTACRILLSQSGLKAVPPALEAQCLNHWASRGFPGYLYFHIHPALFTIAKVWKQPKCLPMDKWIKKMWYTYTADYYFTWERKSCHLLQHAWALRVLC